MTRDISYKADEVCRDRNRTWYLVVLFALALGLGVSMLLLVPRIVYGGNKCESEVGNSYELMQPRITACNNAKERVLQRTIRTAEKATSIARIKSYVKRSHTGLECRLRSDNVVIANPWSGEIERVPFVKLHISVDHPLVGNTDPEPYGLRTPLTVNARGPTDKHGSPQQCILYSTLIDPERVTSKTWSKIDQLLAALISLGASVERWRPRYRWRPLYDRLEFDEGFSQSHKVIDPPLDGMVN